MQLTPREKDKLLIFTIALLAERRRKRGLKMNHPEAISLISATILESVRDGYTMSEVINIARKVLTKSEVMEGVHKMISHVQVEATFPDGTKLVTVHNPIV